MCLIKDLLLKRRFILYKVIQTLINAHYRLKAYFNKGLILKSFVYEDYKILYTKHRIANKAYIRNIGVIIKRP
jgi:hypothetical protein